MTLVRPDQAINYYGPTVQQSGPRTKFVGAWRLRHFFTSADGEADQSARSAEGVNTVAESRSAVTEVYARSSGGHMGGGWGLNRISGRNGRGMRNMI